MKIFKTYILILLFTTFELFSQEEDFSKYANMSLEDLMNVKVTTVSKVSESISTAPATVYVINSEQILRKGYQNLEDFLNEIPGIQISRKAGTESSNIISIRGIPSSSRFLILIDGIPFQSPGSSQFAIDYNFPINYADRIEVILGPASALYGANASSGVINIISKIPKNKDYLNVKSSYGMFNTLDNSILAGYQKEDFSIFLNATYHHSDEPVLPDYYPDSFKWYNNNYKSLGQMDLFGKTVTVPIQKYSAPTDDYFILGKINYNNFSVGFSKNYDSHSSSVSGPDNHSLYVSNAVYANSITQFYIKNSFSILDDKLSITSTLSYNAFELLPKSNYLNVFSSYSNAYKYAEDNSTKLEEQLSYNINENSSIIFGSSYEIINSLPKTGDLPNEFNTNIPASQQDLYWPGTNIVDKNGLSLKLQQEFLYINYTNVGSYLQYQSKLMNNLNVTIGSRFDNNSRYGSTFNPRLGLVYSPIHSLTFKLLFGKAYVAPPIFNAYQQFGSFKAVKDSLGNNIGIASDFIHLANGNLNPEITNSFESSLQYLFDENMSININGFYNTTDNLITSAIFTGESYLGIPIKFIEKPINNGNSVSYGSSVNLKRKLDLFDTYKFYLNIDYSYINGNIHGNPLPFTANNTLKASVGIQNNIFNFTLNVLWRSGSNTLNSTNENPMISKSFIILNAYSSYEISNFLKIYLNSKNILNSKYYTAGQYLVNTPQDPVRLSLGFNFKFN